MAKDVHNLEKFLDVIKRLRDPENGCPWDQKQTCKTLVPYTLEEAYEVVDAVDRDDKVALCDELGDLLLQIALMSQIASEQQWFNFDDVVAGITQKMTRRHPHVFADTEYTDEQEQKKVWEKLKKEERAAQQQNSTFAGIPLAMPALQRSQKIQKRAARLGFDWGHWSHIIPKIQEELIEVTTAVELGESFERVEEEVGDVLMGASNLARQLNVDPENALRLANHKFQRRFEEVENILLRSGVNVDDASLEQMEMAWEQAKNNEKKPS